MKKIIVLLATLAFGSLAHAGGAPVSPGKLLKVIELEEKMQIPVRISVAVLQAGTSDNIVFHAVNKNLEGDLEPYKERILEAKNLMFQNHQTVAPPFSQLVSVSALKTSAVQLNKFDQQQFNNAMMAYLFATGLPLKLDLARLTGMMNTHLRVTFAPKTLDEQLSVLNGQTLTMTGQTQIAVRSKNGHCFANMSIQLGMADIQNRQRLHVAQVDLEKAPDIAQYCDL